MAVSEFATKFHRLGFEKKPLGFELSIGGVLISAAEHPWKGVVLIFTSVQARRMIQFDVALPAHCSVEQIAVLIYANFRSALLEHADACRQHFEVLDIHVFQLLQNLPKI